MLCLVSVSSCLTSSCCCCRSSTVLLSASTASLAAAILLCIATSLAVFKNTSCRRALTSPDWYGWLSELTPNTQPAFVNHLVRHAWRDAVFRYCTWLQVNRNAKTTGCMHCTLLQAKRCLSQNCMLWSISKYVSHGHANLSSLHIRTILASL